MNLFDNLPTPFFALAPMEAVTDLVFRQVVAKAGRPDLFFTEFTNVDSYCSKAGRANALERFEFLPEEQPIVAQVWGTKPDNFYQTALGLKELGYQAVDINMGCPDKTVIKIGGGAALIKNPELADEIITATKETELPVSIKTRLGYSRIDEWRNWLTNLLEQDIDLLTVHLRTKKEMSKVGAHFELIPEIVALRNEIAPQTKLMINGDIMTRAQGLELAKKHGFEGIMMGRGVFTNPYCFTDYQPTRQDLFQLLLYHLDLFDKASAKHPRHFAPLKTFFKIYINNFAGANKLRAKLMQTTSTNEVRKIIKEYNA